MFDSLDELLNYIKSNQSDLVINYDIVSKNLLVINKTTDQVLFDQILNYQIGEFKTAIEPLFTSMNYSVEYVENNFI